MNLERFSQANCTIIAEASANHNQDYDTAVRMVRAAAQCGVDVVKFQAYTPDTITLDCQKEYFQIKHTKWKGQSLYQLYEKAYTPWEWFSDLKKECEDNHIVFLCTVFDKSSVDFLEDLGVTVYKIASQELVDIELVRYAASTGKPLIMSTGMASLEEISEAYEAATKAGAGEITLLKCTSSYPAKPEEMSLVTIPEMRKRFGCKVGLSDHTRGVTVPLVAIGLGAEVIEKHFILSRDTDTPDSFFSLDIDELCELVKSVRVAEKSIGVNPYEISESENKNRIFRRSLFAVRPIRKGAVIQKDDVRSIRPGHGLPVKYLDDVIGKTAAVNIERGEPITWYSIEGF